MPNWNTRIRFVFYIRNILSSVFGIQLTFSSIDNSRYRSHGVVTTIFTFKAFLRALSNRIIQVDPNFVLSTRKNITEMLNLMVTQFGATHFQVNKYINRICFILYLHTLVCRGTSTFSKNPIK